MHVRAFAALLAVLALVAAPRAAFAARAVDLYTVGQGNYLYATYGHSILCVRDAGDKPGEGKGQCYDYGVADKPDTLYVLWSSLRGKSIFTPVKIDDKSLVAFFLDQGRAMERQVLPLSPEEAEALGARLESDVATRWSYAYHPYTANCSSQLRDRIDEATKGRLHAGLADPGKATYRQRMEAGLTGRMFELMAVSLILGPSSDRAPNGWEAMFVPDGLRDGVAERLGVKPEALAERQAVILPTTAAAGRMALFLLAFFLFLGVRLGARAKRLPTAARVVGILLGLTALAIDATALVSTWSELSRNTCLVVLLPTDLALGWLRGGALRTYVRVRLALVLLVGLLELAGVISQPMLASVALVALPFAGLLGALRSAEAPARPREESASPPAARAA